MKLTQPTQHWQTVSSEQYLWFKKQDFLVSVNKYLLYDFTVILSCTFCNFEYTSVTTTLRKPQGF